MKGQRAEDGPQVHSEGVARTEPGGAEGPRKPGEVEEPNVHAGVEGGRSAGTRTTGLGGSELSKAGGGATGSYRPGEMGSWQVQGGTPPVRGGGTDGPTGDNDNRVVTVVED